MSSRRDAPGDVQVRLAALARRYRLSGEAIARLSALLELLLEDPLAPTAIRDPLKAVDDHLADSLVGLELDAVLQAREAVDIGSGAGLPGLVLAIALPAAGFVLLESASRKSAFLERAANDCGLSNVRVVHVRAESWPEGIGRHDLATARAVAPLEVVLEYAAPLLRVGGTMVAWRGRRDEAAETAAGRAAEQLGMGPLEVKPVAPYPGVLHRHLYVTSKVMETPRGFPRRPGVALKRPLGAPAR